MSEQTYIHHEREDVNELWDALLEFGIEEQTLQVVTYINGYTWDSLADIAYVMYGMRVNTIEDVYEEW